MSFHQSLSEKINKDSFLAFGLSMMPPKLCREIESNDFNGRAFEVLEYLNEAEALTVTAVARLLGQNRGVASRSLNTLWYANMVKWLAVCGNKNIFKLWITADNKPPKKPNDACKLAIFGFYYALAKKEVPGFEWRLIRNPKSPLLAEMTYITKESGKLAKIIIDAPRRGDKPYPDANIYIFPTIEEAETIAPAGKKYTSDIYLLDNSGNPLSKRLFTH